MDGDEWDNIDSQGSSVWLFTHYGSQVPPFSLAVRPTMEMPSTSPGTKVTSWSDPLTGMIPDINLTDSLEPGFSAETQQARSCFPHDQASFAMAHLTVLMK